MKRLLICIALLCSLPIALSAESRNRDEGTIVRMRMADCIAPHHPFMTAMGGPQTPTNELCPEYVLVTNKVVYVIVGRNSDQLVPLAETTFFHLQNGEVLIRIDDARRESHFHVKEMVLRPEWDRGQQLMNAAAMEAITAHGHLQAASVVGASQ